jgi:hypothetical protein
MAENPRPHLIFSDGCGDCGEREVDLPEPLPPLGDDFDWLVRDYDGFRLFMMEELAARFPERRRWTPADMEVVLVEALSVVLDGLSDGLDRIHAEAFLATARRPESVRRLLSMIGYDAVLLADPAAGIPEPVPTVGESTAEKRRRLKGFLPALHTFLEDYRAILDAELTPLQRSRLNDFIQEPEEADAPALDAVQHFLDNAPEFVSRARNDALERHWTRYPHAMDAARAAGPRAVHTQTRMVTLDDYANRLTDHPLVMRAQAVSEWSGSWTTLRVAAVLRNNVLLDDPLTAAALGGAEARAALGAAVDDFHHDRSLPVPALSADPASRTVLRPYLDAYRMAGQEVFLQDAEPVGIRISLSVRVASNYFRSEVRRAVRQRLGTGLGGFFAPGRLDFGEDLHASDVIEAAMALDGVESVCLNRFKRVGKRYPDRSGDGRIRLDGLEIAVCDNDPSRPERGTLRITAHGGRTG